MNALQQIVDGLDIETFFICKTEQEGRSFMLELIKGMGFTDVDIVFVEHSGLGARVRGRAYVHRPADHYAWMSERDEP